MVTWHKLSLVSSVTLIALSVFAGCGGRSEDDQGTGGSAGAAAGGAGQGQGGRPGGAGGQSFGGSSSGGAPVGQGGGTQDGGCLDNGRWYKTGESFKSSDGCNTCTCLGNNSVACTLMPCPNICPSIASQYPRALEEAKFCNPTLSVEQCTALDAGDPNCRCPTFVNSNNAAAREELAKLLVSYDENQCAGGIVCGACLEPKRGYCSAAGRCEDFNDGGGAASCQVNGKVYPDGATGIRDPFSCNSCSCSDGALVCTEINCPQPCPPNSVPGERCLLCGPADGCELVEIGCLPLCSDTCPNPAETCVNGACRQRCG